MFYIQVYENFINNDHSQEWFDFIDSLGWMDRYLKESLKNDPDVLELWEKTYSFSDGVKEMVMLFNPKYIEYYNSIIRSLHQNSYIRNFYRDVDEFVIVLKRLLSFTELPDKRFILTQILNRCNPVALRYMSEDCLSHILANKQLARYFRKLWVLPSSKHYAKEGDITSFKKNWYRGRKIKPFLPTSDEEHEEKIVEIILDSM